MPITQEQRIERRKRLGSSDSPAVLGVDPWRTPADVYLSKVHDLEEISSEAIEIGNDFEVPLIGWAARELGIEVDVNVQIVDPENDIFAANLDARARGRREGIEAKTTSMPDEYGDEGTDQVPDRVIIQTQHQMMVAELDLVWVPVLMPRFDRLRRALYKVERSEPLIDLIRSRGAAFWQEHVLTKTRPAFGDVAPSPDVLARIRRIPEKTCEVAPALVSAYEDAKSREREAATESKEARCRLLAAMSDAEVATFGDDQYCYTYLEQTRTGIDLKKLRARHPEIAAKFEKVSVFRVLRRKRRG